MVVGQSSTAGQLVYVRGLQGAAPGMVVDIARPVNVFGGGNGRNRNRRVQLIVSASQVTAPAVRESVAPAIAPIPQAVVPSAAGRP